jgi:hypothetical protein
MLFKNKKKNYSNKENKDNSKYNKSIVNYN